MIDMEFNIAQVADMLGLQRTPQKCSGQSFYVKCPICDKTGYHLNINVAKGTWRCAKCGESGGTIGLYVRFGLGEAEYTKQAGHKAVMEIQRQLGLKTDFTPKETEKECEDNSTRLTDSELHAVYSCMLKIPALKLSAEHIANLKDRGMDEDSIKRNGYRTLPERLLLPKGRRSELDKFKNMNYQALCEEQSELARLRKRDVFSGVYIGTYLHNYMKVNLDNVPGFFKVGGLWCFKYTAGMLIPVRNRKGEIVNFQIRTDKGRVRYITNSSSGFEAGTTGQCRVHFPIINPKICEDTVIRLTEGALKADIAASFNTNPNIAYMAILGVNATTAINDTLTELKESGCKTITNAFDMDKITNPHVAKAAQKIREIVQNNGYNYSCLFWGGVAAKKLVHEQEKVMRDNGISPCSKASNVFYNVLYNTLKMYKNGIDYPEWSDKNTKGIDDYLNFKRRSA